MPPQPTSPLSLALLLRLPTFSPGIRFPLCLPRRLCRRTPIFTRNRRIRHLHIPSSRSTSSRRRRSPQPQRSNIRTSGQLSQTRN